MKIKSIAKYIDARDVFVLTGFILLFMGIGRQFGYEWALMITGGIILLKGLTRWL